MSNLSIGGPRWLPAFDAAAATGIGNTERARPLPTDQRGQQVGGSEGRPDDEGQEGRNPRRGAPDGTRLGGAPDPSGNAGRRLDAFA